MLVRAAWSLCQDDMNCLFDAVQLNLDTAQSLGLKVALAIGDWRRRSGAAGCEIALRAVSVQLSWRARDHVPALGQQLPQ